MKKEPSKEEILVMYRNTKEKIDKYGYTVIGTVDGKDALKRPLAYTIGLSNTTNHEIVTFFPVKQKDNDPGMKIITNVIKNIIDRNITFQSKIIKDEKIYYLPFAMLILDENTKNDVEKVWAGQLTRDSLLSEYSKDDHKLALLIFTDKHGNLPWKDKCESYWPNLCPPPLVAMAQLEITGSDSLLSKIEKDYNIEKKEN